MGPWENLQAFLETGTDEIACGENFALVHAYAELIASGGDLSELHAVTSHLKQCPPCAEELQGLLAAMRGAAR